MAYVHSPRTVTDGLVFFYDTGNTLKSYRGEPTTNLATDTPSQGGWPGSYTLIESSTKTFELTTSSIPWGGTDAWTTFYYDVSEYTGQYVTISAVFEYPLPSATGGTFNFMMIGQTVNTQTYLGYSGESDRNSKSTATRETVSWSGVIGDGGKVGIMIWMSATAPAELTVRFSNIQVEAKPHATPFVNGSRSATQGLLDLTGNSTIDLSNVSFDDDAQMTFDGSNDSLVVGNNAILKNNNTSVEFIIKYLNTPNGDIIQFGVGSGEYAQYYYRAYSGNSYWNFYAAGGDGVGDITIPNAALPLNKFHHIVMTGDAQGYVQFYINGIAQSGANRSSYSQAANWTPADLTVGGFSWDGYSSSEIPYVKIYNRVITASEIANNYNAVKSRFGI